MQGPERVKTVIARLEIICVISESVMNDIKICKYANSAPTFVESAHIHLLSMCTRLFNA